MSIRPGRAARGSSRKFFNFVGLAQGKRIVFNKNFFNRADKYFKAIVQGLNGLKSGAEISVMIARVAGASIKRNFKVQGSPKHDGRWRALKRTTKDDRERQGFSRDRPILIRSGNLFIAATEGLQVGRAYSQKAFITISPRKFRDSPYDKRGISSKAYFDLHNMGGWAPTKSGGTSRIPRRQFFIIRRKDAVIIGDLLWAIALRRASKVSRRSTQDEIALAFSHRMKSLNLSNKDFLNSNLINKITKVAISRVSRGLE